MTGTAIGGQSGTATADIADHICLLTRAIVRIHLFGSMRATSYLGDDVAPRAKKPRAILGYLCLASGERVSRTRLARMLWDGVSAEQARASFRQALSEVTSAMGPLTTELISTGDATVRLNTDACWIDALALLKAPYAESTRADLAVLCPGELLEGLDDVSASFGEWLAKERIRFKQRLANSLDFALQQLDQEDFDARQVAEVARRLIAFDPTNQRASRTLMRALAKLGEREEALREFERCREALRIAFRVKPAIESERLYQTLREHPPQDGTEGSPVTQSADQGERNFRVALSERGRLRVGVLPFAATDRPNEKSLALSLSHEIAAGLARFRWFDVIAPESLRRPLSTGGEHEFAGLDYVVDGSIAGTGKRLHVSVRLTDLAGKGQPVWSEQFDIALSQLHRLDELVTTRIVGRIDPVILHIEGQPKRRENYGATGLLLLAIPMTFSMQRKQYEEAGRLIRNALALEPKNAMAEAWAAHWHLFYSGQGWAKDYDMTNEQALEHALKAITLDPENADALGIYAHSCSRIANNFDRALLFFDRALRLNPSSAFTWALSALTYCYIGEPDAALQRLKRYRQLASPDLYFSFFESFYTIAYTFKGDYQRAVLAGRRAIEANANFTNGYKPLIASLGHLGRREEAEVFVNKLLSLEPDFTVEKFGQLYSIKKNGRSRAIYARLATRRRSRTLTHSRRLRQSSNRKTPAAARRVTAGCLLLAATDASEPDVRLIGCATRRANGPIVADLNLAGLGYTNRFAAYQGAHHRKRRARVADPHPTSVKNDSRLFFDTVKNAIRTDVPLFSH